ncbi:MAG: carbohydrate ABC transporter permease [Spirochaetales bacterium]|nr:carbohydrate ABC transporter permease [Spirochaetales bacterium]
MKSLKTQKTSRNFLGIIMALIAVIWLIPVYFMLINSFKPLKDVIFTTAAFPKSLYLENITKVWEDANYFRLFLNSLMVTASSLFFVVLFASMSGWRLARKRSRGAKILLNYFILTLIIPFQAIMIPLVKTMKSTGLIDSITGLVLVYIAMATPMPIYLYYGYIKSIPRSLEESARIDGAGINRTFFSIIFPLLTPMTSTIIILQALYIWNDFLLPLIVIQSERFKTIPIGITGQFFGQYQFKWNLGITAMLLASLPMIILYIFMQRKIISGIVNGAVKG